MATFDEFYRSLQEDSNKRWEYFAKVSTSIESTSDSAVNLISVTWLHPLLELLST